MPVTSLVTVSRSPSYHPHSPSPTTVERIAQQGMELRSPSPDGDAESSNPIIPPPQEFMPIPYHLMVNPKPYSQEPSPSPTDYMHEPSPVPTAHTWHITNGIPGGALPPSTNPDSSNGSG
ncbi:hypothetical protein ARMSODRAFT_1019795 [Armillaria solidipes]|uniref:Uncharacterized protein n=1 Tax=Armillaria solidipes TaxID=1076256 RepID=A0A2H3BBF3_9AGAR|nr:hypothetical protein ARMSODRAFT_1019795 [Armillaria solidipes]